MFNDNLRLALHNLLHRRLRSWLTILGIVVGVAAVVALVSIGSGMQRAVKKQFETVGVQYHPPRPQFLRRAVSPRE